jgi:protein regulator of cytokinesis 1
MKTQIDTKRKKIESLWNYLSIDEHHRKKFAKYTDYTQVTYSVLTQELESCEQIKRENMKSIIEKVRIEIAEMWNKCLKSDQEKRRFTAYNSITFTEDLLALHEMELEELNSFYNKNIEIFDLIKERKDLWDRMLSLEMKANDPNRYNNRGGQLLKEEKERKMITNNLPKIESKLISLVKEYDDSHKRPFTVVGERVQDIIDHDWEQKKQDKLTKSGRKVPATPGRTPSHTTMMRTPRTVDTTKNSAIKNSAARKNLQIPSISVSSSTTSSSASISVNGKRKLPPLSSCPNAKRTLMTAFNSPAPRAGRGPVTPRTIGSKLLSSARSPLKPHNYGNSLSKRVS